MTSKIYQSPLYIQVKEILLKKIREGEYSQGSKLPSERELSIQYGLSRMTARNALNELVNEGWAYKNHGKGTFVSYPKIERDLIELCGFSQVLKSRGITPKNKIIEMRIEEAKKNIAASLGISIGEKIYLIKRLRCGNDFPIAIEYSYLPCKLLEGLLNYNFEEESLFEVIERDYNRILTFAEQTLSLSRVDGYEAELLDVEDNSPILLFESITYDEKNIPVEFARSLTRGDRCIFRTGLRRPGK